MPLKDKLLDAAQVAAQSDVISRKELDVIVSGAFEAFFGQLWYYLYKYDDKPSNFWNFLLNLAEEFPPTSVPQEFEVKRILAALAFVGGHEMHLSMLRDLEEYRATQIMSGEVTKTLLTRIRNRQQEFRDEHLR